MKAAGKPQKDADNGENNRRGPNGPLRSRGNRRDLRGVEKWVGGKLWLRGMQESIGARDEVYPAAFRELLQRLGIDPNKESEAVADGPLKNGLHHYGGWFFFVGQMVTAGESISVISESPYFGYFFARGGPCPKEFRDVPRLAVAFEADFKWVLKESWVSELRPAAINPRLSKTDPA